MTIQVGGIVSGLETESLIEQLLEIEQEPINIIESKQDAYTVQLSAYGELQTKLNALDDALENLDSTIDFNTYTTTSGDDDIFTATAGVSAVPGTYDVTVAQLAKAHKLKSSGFTQTQEMVQFTVGATNKFLDFTENGGAELTATLTEGNYTVSELVTEIQTQLDAASVAGGNSYTYTVSYSDTSKGFTIAKNTGGLTDLDILWSSGTNNANSAASLLGFDATDDNDATTHSSDNEVGEGTLHLEIGSTFTIDSDNNKLNFKENIGVDLSDELTATITSGTYTIKELETAVKTAMESASDSNGNSLNYTVSYDASTQKFSIAEDGASLTELQFLWSSGTNASDNIASTMGFAATDDTGATTYTSDSTVGTVVDVTIKATDTIEEVAEAINDADADITATVIFDGTNYILTLAGDNTGEDNVINLTVTDGDGNNTDTTGLSRLAYDAGVTTNLTQTQGAQNAIIHVDGVTNITRSANTVSDVITGITLNLKEAHTTPATDKDTLTVARDTSSISTNIDTFVSAYNDVLDFFSEYQKKYDDDEETVGLLFGDSTTNRIRRTLRSQLSSEFQLNTSATFTIDDDNDKLDFKINTGSGIGSELTATIPNGTYTIGALEIAIENAMETASGQTYSVSYDNNTQKFSITGQGLTELQLLWSSGSNIINGIGTTIGYNAVDDSGSTSYTADNVTGNTGTTTSYAYTSLADIGIALNQETDPRLELTATTLNSAMSSNFEHFRTFFSQSTTGAEGFAVKMKDVIDSIIDSVDGTLTARKTGITTSIGRLETKKETLETKLEDTEVKLWARFNSLELLLAQYQTTGDFLTQQIVGLQNLSRSISG